MAGQKFWFLLAVTMSVSPPVSASSEEEYARGMAQLGVQVCLDHSCRGMCNISDEALSRRGIHQLCKCDEKCFMLDDCCHDFASACPETYQRGYGKYPFFHTDCFNGATRITALKEKLETSTTFTPESSTYSTLRSASDIANVGTIYRDYSWPVPFWIKMLWETSQVRVDRANQLLFSHLFHARGRDEYSYSILEQTTACLKLNTPVQSVSEIKNEDISIVTMANFPEPVNTWRSCCHSSKSGMTELASGLETDTHNVANTSYVKMKHFPSTSKQTGGLVKVTVTPDPGKPVSTFRSRELPWSVFQCLEHEVVSYTCEILSCAVGRVLSTDKRACFIPTQIRIHVIRDRNSTFTSLPLAVPGRFGNAPSSFPSPQNLLSGARARNLTDAIQHRSPAPAALCLAVIQLVQSQRWDVTSLSLSECRVQFRTDGPSRGKHGSNRDVSPENGCGTNGKHKAHENENALSTVAPSRKTDSSSLDSTRGVSESIRNQERITELADDPFLRSGSMNNDQNNIVNQVWDLIHKHLDILPDIAGIDALEICFETKPDQLCLQKEDAKSCADRSSTCSTLELLQTSAGARSMSYTHFYLPVPGPICVAVLLALFLIDLQSFRFE